MKDLAQKDGRSLQKMSPSPVQAKKDNLPSRTEPPVAKRQIVKKHTSAEISSDEMKTPQELFDEVLLLAKNKEYEKALINISRLIDEHPSLAGTHTLKASILINLKRIAEAKEICLKTIEDDQLHLESYLLLGLIAKIEDNNDELFKRFREALYVQPASWLAHFYLAEAFHRLGETERAHREYSIVLRLLEKGSMSDHGLAFFPLSFSADEVMHLCRHNRRQLNLEKENQWRLTERNS
jgi:chemotaxis protein methyltransferase CheR